MRRPQLLERVSTEQLHGADDLLGRDVGYRYVLHAVDNHSRLACSEIHDDERKETVAAL